MKTVTIRCAYCQNTVTIEIHPSILARYGADYEPTRCAPCEYLKTRREQTFREKTGAPRLGYPGAEQMMRWQREDK